VVTLPCTERAADGGGVSDKVVRTCAAVPENLLKSERFGFKAHSSTFYARVSASTMICSLLLVAIVACHVGDGSVLKFEPEDDVNVERVEIAQAATGSHWALIVAGSNGWDNYRHQVTMNYSVPPIPIILNHTMGELEAQLVK